MFKLFKRHKHEFEPVIRITERDGVTGTIVETIISECRCGSRVRKTKTRNRNIEEANKLFSIKTYYQDDTCDNILAVGKTVDDILTRNQDMYDGTITKVVINEIKTVDDYRVYVSDNKLEEGDK